MAGRYDLRSQQEVHHTAYAALPGTASMQFITHNITPMKSKLSPGREVIGCHPGRWIYELTHNAFTVCDLFDRARLANLPTPLSWQHPHRLVVNGCQTVMPIVSAVCLDCHFHFVFKISYDEEHEGELCHAQKPCWPVQDSDFLWHHLVWVGSDSETNIARDSSKYYPLLAREFFTCSAPPCTFEVTLEVSEPRMSASWIKLLQDREAIRAQLRLAKEQEPQRYETASEEWVTQAPINLNTYLKNLLDATSDEEVRSISKRNKRFAVCFGPRCFEIFRQLEFFETVKMRDGIDEGSFTPRTPEPPPGPMEPTKIGTYRAYLEDVRSETQCLIHKGGQSPEKPSFCLPLLCTQFGCERPALEENPVANVEKYKLLGILPDSRKEIVVNAYKRQWELLPNKRKALIDALMSVANDVGDEELIDYAMMQSSVFESQLQRACSEDDDDGVVSQALTFLGLVPPNTHTATELVEAFRRKIIDDPADASTARSMLSLIAQVSKDDAYRATLLMETDVKMSLSTAKTVLGLVGASGFGPEALDTAKAKIKISTTNDEAALYLDAIEAIAEHTHSTDLKSAVNDMRRGRGISFMNDDGSSAIQRRALDLDLPVGLENIGNTCYLNSLLQYLFTVKPVRDIALNYESFKLDLTDEDIKGRLLGGNKMQMDRGEAVVAQAFAQELSKLFSNLLTSDMVATRPSQRLANAVLLSTHTLLNNPKQATESTETRKPPPLPARPPPSVPTKPSEDVVMVSGVDAAPDVCDAISSDSSTLVDANDDDSDHSYEKIEKSSTMEDVKATAMTAEQSNDDVEMKDIQTNLATVEPSVLAMEGGTTNEKAQENPDVKMSEPEEPETVDQKVLTALEHQKRSSGTDQQDVEEVMGSILNRLQAAIRPSSVDETSGIQLEKIMETFFVTTINYTKKFDETTYQQEVSFDRSITAFPALEGSCSLYDALGRNFDQQIIEESKLSRYTAIKTLPPVLHVLIQRSQSMGSKNGNPVVIPETLFLDRYMDYPHDDPVFQQRIENWMIEDRISDVKGHMAKSSGNPTGPFLHTYDPSGKAGLAAAEHSAFLRNFEFDGPVEDEFMMINKAGSEENAISEKFPEVEPPASLDEIEDLELFIRDMMEKELRHREEVLKDRFAKLTNIPYRLHAVICHRGQLVSGHYWVWIHDFEKDLWRKYNDSNVEENRNTEEVLQTLSTSGEPYFLCYVRDGDKDEYVDVPIRQVKPETDTDSGVDADGDVMLPTTEPDSEHTAKTEIEDKRQPESELPPAYAES